AAGNTDDSKAGKSGRHKRAAARSNNRVQRKPRVALRTYRRKLADAPTPCRLQKTPGSRLAQASPAPVSQSALCPLQISHSLSPPKLRAHLQLPLFTVIKHPSR